MCLEVEADLEIRQFSALRGEVPRISHVLVPSSFSSARRAAGDAAAVRRPRPAGPGEPAAGGPQVPRRLVGVDTEENESYKVCSFGLAGKSE